LPVGLVELIPHGAHHPTQHALLVQRLYRTGNHSRPNSGSQLRTITEMKIGPILRQQCWRSTGSPEPTRRWNPTAVSVLVTRSDPVVGFPNCISTLPTPHLHSLEMINVTISKSIYRKLHLYTHTNFFMTILSNKFQFVIYFTPICPHSS
jgi:hypothetical protein